MKLTKNQIKQIDDYLVKLKVKYIDVRLELIDHLATDFEENSKYVLIEDYLRTKIDFIKDFENKRQKTIHWSYQKDLWRRMAMFFYKPKYMFLTLIFGVSVYGLQKLQPNKIAFVLFLLIIVAINLGAIVSQFNHKKTFKKLQAAQPLYSILGLPSLFLFMPSGFKSFFENQYFFIAFWFLALLFNVAGAIELYQKKEAVLKYNTMIN